MIRQHLHFNIPDNVDATIWRYQSIDKLRSLLEEEALFFCRADLLGDDHEGTYSKPTIERRPIFYEGAKEHYLKEGLPEETKLVRRCTYISCWHVSRHESVAMWRLYSDEDKSVVVKSKVSSLKLSILDAEREFLLHPVSYVDYDKDFIPDGNVLSPFFFKQKIYEHESEFRIIATEFEKIGEIVKGKIEPPEGLFIKVDLRSLIDAIIVSPFSDGSFQEKVTALLTQHNLLDKLAISSVTRKPDY